MSWGGGGGVVPVKRGGKYLNKFIICLTDNIFLFFFFSDSKIVYSDTLSEIVFIKLCFV